MYVFCSGIINAPAPKVGTLVLFFLSEKSKIEKNILFFLRTQEKKQKYVQKSWLIIYIPQRSDSRYLSVFFCSCKMPI